MSARSPSGSASTVTVACSIPSYQAARHGLASSQAAGSPSLSSTGTTRIGSERRVHVRDAGAAQQRLHLGRHVAELSVPR